MRRAFLFLFLSAVSFSAGQKIVGGPAAVNVTARTATIVWIVQSDEATLRPAGGGPVKSAPSLHMEKVVPPEHTETVLLPSCGSVAR